ncbi:unnamed protein product [Cylindrotheca closterium]|uniref:ENTH domain-containing protein n=1 Tax=Cylindrotheca closterium TaxID=2856 RepID=A0AAD2G7Y6_9STRA|nr:unnamed protein product [Cylindrotheca closterium]
MDRQLLARATENSDAPTPGYMYNDIAKNAASNPAVCSDVAKYLTGRLASKNNHNIKYKCLKVVSKTATSPYLRGQFKRCLSIDPQAMGAIKEALQFRGPPDPVRGDEPYERVRVAAKEALDAIYSDTPADQTAGGSFASVASSSYGPSAGQQGFSSQSYVSSSTNPGARRMEGIGNPMFKDPRMEPDTPNPALANVISEAKDTIIGMIKDPLARNPTVGVSRNSYNGGGSSGVGSYSGSGSYNPQSSYPPGRSELMQQTNGQWTMKSNRGPEAVAPPPNYHNDSAYYKSQESGNAYAWAQKSAGSSGGVGGSWASSAPSGGSQARQPSYAEQHQSTPSITISGGTTNLSGGGGTALADGSYEKQLVMELCPPGGMKAEPPPDKLNSFARSVASLNPDLVCPVLLDCLEDGQPWIIRAKALCVMECCIRNGQKPGAGNNPYADFFHACGAEIAPLANHPRAAIKDPTKRVLSLLGIAVPVGSSAAPVSHQSATAASASPPPVTAPSPAEPVPNLLDFGDTVECAKPPPEQPPPPPPAEGNSLFGGLTVAGAPAAPPASPSSGNLLGDLMDGVEHGPSPPSGQNMFGGLNVKSDETVAAKEVAQASSMFESLEVKSEETETEVIAPAPAASAFGFMNQAAATTETTTTVSKETTQAVASSAVPSSWDSFDPLNSNVTPNTAKKMAQAPPQQMQALAYQQMIMQQQMQMAQMMAMQRGQPGMFQQMPGIMAGNMVMRNPAAARTSFAFPDGESKKKDDKSFDFVKDAITMEKKK